MGAVLSDQHLASEMAAKEDMVPQKLFEKFYCKLCRRPVNTCHADRACLVALTGHAGGFTAMMYRLVSS